MYRFLNWLSPSLSAHWKKQRGSRRAQARRSRPELDSLEDRCVPAVLFRPHFGNETLDPSSVNNALQGPHVNVLYWGSYWATAAGKNDVANLTFDIKTITESPYVSGLIQYGSNGFAFMDNGGFPYVDSKTPLPTTPEGSPPQSVEAVLPSEIITFINNTVGFSGVSKGAVPLPNDLNQDPKTNRSDDTVYVVITEPGVQLIPTDKNGNPLRNTDGTEQLAGVGRSGNQLGSFQGSNYHFISLTTGTTSTGTVDLEGAALAFSHELAEGMSYDDQPVGVTVDSSPGAPTSIANGFQQEQIADMEPEAYSYRLDGLKVAPYFSHADHGDFIVPDANKQQMILDANDWTVTTNPDFTTTASFGGHYDLTIQGDQFGSGTNDVLTINDMPSGTHVILNGEFFNFDPGVLSNIHVNLGDGNDRVNIDGLTGENVTIALGTGNDTINIGDTAANLDLTHGNISITGGNGTDTLVVNDRNDLFGRVWDVSGSSILRSNSAPIDYSGIANVVLQGGKGDDTFNLSPTAKNLDELPGANLTPFLFGSQGTTLQIDGGAGANTLILNDQSNPNGSFWSVTGNAVTRTHAHRIGFLTESLSFSVAYSNIADLALHAGSGNDTFNLSPTAQDLSELPGTSTLPFLFGSTGSSLQIDGGTGTNSLVLNDQNNPNSSAWSVTGKAVTRSYSQRIGFLFEQVSSTVDYSNIANLTLHAGKGDDTFTLSPTAQNLDELPGLNVSSPFPPSSLTNSLTVDGGSGNNTLVVDDRNNPIGSSWAVTGNNVIRSHFERLGLLLELVSSSISFSNVANLALHAGKGNDTITLSPTAQNLGELPGTNEVPFLLGSTGSTFTVDGGAGTKSLIFDDQKNAFNSGWNVTDNSVARSHKIGSSIFSPTISSSIGYSNVSNVTINAGSGSNSFLISSTPATGHVTVNGGSGANRLTTNNGNHGFTINGHDAGAYANVSFSNIGSLTGGTGMDIFKFLPAGKLDGTINGGGAPAGQGDWLDYSAFIAPVTVDLATGSATAVTGGVSNIQNVIGSAGNDALTGNALGNILIGGAATNVITGGSGRSLLIGGTGTSLITGGASDDILIAGTTTFDANETALMAILNEWQRTDKTYAQRIADLRTGGGFNGSNKLILRTTVLDNDKASLLTGGSGLDWFFADLGSKGTKDLITDLTTGEVVN